MHVEVYTINQGGNRVTARLEVDPDEGVESLKSKIHQHLGILPYRQRLIAYSAESEQRRSSPVTLQTGSSLREHGLTQYGTVIKVEIHNREGMEMTVKKLGGKIALTMYPPVVCTILDVKRMIGDLEGTPPDHQRLIHAGRTLENDQYLANYGFIDSGNTIDLVPKVCHRFSCSLCKGKDMVVELPGGHSFQLEVEPSTTVEKVKTRIEEKGEVPLDHQVLYIGTKLLEDGHTLEDYLEHFRKNRNSSLRVELSCKVPMWFKLYTGKSWRIDVDIYHPLESLKPQIESKTSTSWKNLCLVQDGRLVESHCSLKETGIQENSVILVGLQLQTQICISVKTLTGKLMTLDVEPWARVGDVKSLIAEKVGVPAGKQALFFKGRCLDDRSTVAECGAQNDSVFCVVYRISGRMHIKITPITGAKFVFEVDATDSILTLKGRLHRVDQINIPPEEQRLVFDGHLLEDQYTVSDYGIQNGSVLYVVPRSGCLLLFIQTLSHKSFSVEVEMKSTVASVKDAIEKKLGVSPKQQCLLFAGREMENDRALWDYSISNRSTLHLVSPENPETG